MNTLKPNNWSDHYIQRHKPQGREGRVMHVFLGADLRCGHDGLRKLAKDAKIDTGELVAGQYILFINAARNKLKLFAAHRVIAYLKLEPGRYLDMRAVAEIPKAFQGSGRIDYDAALKEALEKALARKRRLTVAEKGTKP